MQCCLFHAVNQGQPVKDVLPGGLQYKLSSNTLLQPLHFRGRYST